MKPLTSIQIKAFLLLTVFTINTVVGFACSVGVDMGFNSKHHDKKKNSEIHIHKDGTKHIHSKKTGSESPNQDIGDTAGIYIHKDGAKHIHYKKADSASPSDDTGQTGKTHTHKDGAKHIHAKKELLNSKSQQKDEAGEIHIHKDGKKHVHTSKAGSQAPKTTKEDCCTDDVIKLSQDDKVVASFLKLSNPVYITLITFFYNDLLVNFLPQRTVSKKYFVRGHHPPICGIRIVIQSFQI